MKPQAINVLRQLYFPPEICIAPLQYSELLYQYFFFFLGKMQLTGTESRIRRLKVPKQNPNHALSHQSQVSFPSYV